MATNKVLIELQLIQKGGKVAIVQKETEKLGRATDKLDQKRKKLTKTTDAYNRREKGTAQISSNSTKNFSKMAQSVDGGSGSGGLVRAYALLAANVFALSAAFGILSRSAQIDTLTESMRQLEITSGKSIVGVARNLQEASGFGLDFAESMRAVSLATSAGFGAGQIEELGKVARNAAVSLGRNLPDALDRIFRGVIKVEPELLDEIGLFVRVNDASAKYAATLKIAVGDLTEFQKRQAFLNEAVEQGTSKFEAFASVDNDSFALLATTFADISQEALHFLNKGIGPIVRMLAENKVLFTAVFAAVAATLARLAIPAMAAFTNSIATNAAASAEAASAATSAAQSRAAHAKNTHLEEIARQQKELEGKAKLAMADSQGAMGPSGTIKVGGKEKSLMKEKLLKKSNLELDKRMSTVNQRILDIETGRGKQQRAKNPLVMAELNMLKQEQLIHKDILATRVQQETVNQSSIGGPGSILARTELMAYNASLKAKSLAEIANIGTASGFKASLLQVNIELKKLVANGVLSTGVMGSLGRAMFVLKGGAIALGVAFQGLWMRIMGPLSALLLFLPVFQAINKAMGVGSKVSEDLSKANTSVSEALELLGPRLEHVNEQLAKLGGPDGDAKSFNQGMESFKNTILTTTTAIQEQEKAFEQYVKHASGWAQFWGESLPSFFGFGTANAIKEGKKQVISELLELGDKVTPAMKKALKKSEAAAAAHDKEKRSKRAGKNVKRTKDAMGVADDAVIVQAKLEAEAYINVRSAIEGAKDSARAFQNSLITTTQVDKPLASMRQLETSLLNQNITTEERLQLINEISEDAAVLAMLNAADKKILQDTTLTEGERLKVITDAKDQYFLQQESLIKSAAELKKIQILTKSISSINKVSTAAIAKTFQMEKRTAEIEAEKLKFAKDNALTTTGLDEKRLRELMVVEDIRSELTETELKSTDIKATQAAINKLREYDNHLLQEAFKTATRTARQTKATAQAKISEIKDQETLNKAIRKTAILNASIARFNKTGSTKENTVQEMSRMIADEKSLEKTRKARALQEAIIAKANKEMEARKLDTLAIQEGLLDGEKEQYESAAQVLRDTGDDLYNSIVDGAKDGGKEFKLSILEAFKKVNPGSSAGDDAFGDDSLFGKIGVGIKAISNTDDPLVKQRLALELTEEALLSLADTTDAVLGEEGVLVSALARSSAGFMDLTTSYAASIDATSTTAEKVAAGATAIAAAIGQIMSIVSAMAQQNVQEIDKMISAEKKRDGKSKDSIGKMEAMEKKKEQIQKKAFNINKKLMIAQAIASTAAGIAATLPLMVPPTTGLATMLMGIIAGVGAAQVAIISGLSFAGGGNAAPKPTPQEISIGKRTDKVDVSRGGTGGELSYLRGESGIGSNANNFRPGGAAGMKRGYAPGGEIMIGERGPETITPTELGYQVTPNDKMGGTNLNANITINAIDAAGVEDVLTAQRGTIISMIREAAHEHGEEFIESVNPQTYAGGDG